MPYKTTAELPENVKKLYTERCQSVFLRVFNKTIYDNGGSEEEAFQNAHAAAKNCAAGVQ